MGKFMNKHWEPTRYDASKEARLIAIKNLITWSGFSLDDSLKVLDIGCGNGIVDRYLCETYPNITLLGTDKDAGMIDYAKSNNHCNNLSFAQCDALDLDFNSQFDLVISTSCLHWVKQQDIVLQNVYKALKPTGQVLFLINPRILYLFDAFEIIEHSPEWQSYFSDFEMGYYFYDEQNYTQLAINAGFSVINIKLNYMSYNFKDKATFEGTVASWLPHLKHIPKKRHKLFLNELSTLVLQLMQKDGLNEFIEFPSRTLNIHLQKK